MTISLKRWLLWASPLILALAVYANSFSADFVYDNWGIILRPQALRDKTALAQILSSDWWFNGSNLYRPITTFSFWLDTAWVAPLLASSPQPGWYHLVNLLLHLVNVALLFALARRLSRSDMLAAVIAGIWAVHPLNTEAITNIVGRADELAALGVLAALLLYIKSHEAPGARRWALLLAAAAMALLGMLSKENAIILPAVALAWDLSRVRLPISSGRLQKLFTGWFILGLSAIVMLLLRWAILLPQSPATPNPLENPIPFLSASGRVLTALGVLGNYVTQTFVPLQLSCDYSVPATAIGVAGVASVSAIAGLAVLLAAVVFAGLCWRRGDRVPAFFVAFFLISILPVSNFIIPIGTIRGDRLMYLPMIGLIGAAVTAAARFINIRFLAIAAAALAVVLGARTIQRNLDWRTNITLWHSACVADPKNPNAHDQYAWALYSDPANANNPPMDEIIEHSQKAADLEMRAPEAWRSATPLSNLGVFYARKSQMAPDQQKQWLAQSLQTLEESLQIVQTAATRRGVSTEDIVRFDTALNLGAIRMKTGNRSGANEAFDLMRRAAPGKVETWTTLAKFYALGNDWPAAARAAWCALLLEPKAAQTRPLLVNIYANRQAQAIGPGGLNFANPTAQADLHAAGAELIKLMAARRLNSQAVQQQLRAWSP